MEGPGDEAGRIASASFGMREDAAAVAMGSMVRREVAKHLLTRGRTAEWHCEYCKASGDGRRG